jgi:anti-sigma factor RsiW
MHPNELALSDYVDRALGESERADIERHLDSCAACRSLVEDLREITRLTKMLAPIEPPAAVWRRLEQAIGQQQADLARSTRRSRVRRFGWLAAAAVLVLAAFLGLRLGVADRRQGAAPNATTAATAGDTAGSDAAQTVASELRQAEEHYDKAINGLEQIANAGQGALDAQTASTLQKNLSVIDQAISESRAAVHAQPNSEPAQASLLDNFRTKVGLLQDTVALINEMRKGNDAGAARIVSGLKQKSD